jgi:hypothetical protein
MIPSWSDVDKLEHHFGEGRMQVHSPDRSPARRGAPAAATARCDHFRSPVGKPAREHWQKGAHALKPVMISVATVFLQDLSAIDRTDL